MGFLQALTGLDVADNSHDATSQIIHSLLQGLLGSPDFDSYMTKDKSYPFGMVQYYVRLCRSLVTSSACWGDG
jgi:hypothetical protein